MRDATLNAVGKSFGRLIWILAAAQGVSWYMAWDDQFHDIIKHHRVEAVLLALLFVVVNYIVYDSANEIDQIKIRSVANKHSSYKGARK